MSSYNFKWRIWAKMVAITDMLLISSLQLLGSLLMIYIALGASFEGLTSFTLLMWLVVAIMLLQTGFGTWAAVQLFRATTLGKPANDAYQLSQKWRLVCLVLLLLNIIGGIMFGTFMVKYLLILVIFVFIILALGGALFRFIFLCIVYFFMREVKIAVNTTAQQEMTRQV